MQRLNESELVYRSGMSGVKYLVRGPHIDWGVILLLPGQKLDGHFHREVEETFYGIQGKASFTVNGEIVNTGTGDVLRMETGDIHSIENYGTDDFKVVFIKYPFLPQDKVDI